MNREGTGLVAPILPLVLVAQISDCHIREEPGMFGHLVDTSSSLAATVDLIAALDPAPDVVLATGDLVDDGTAFQYALLLELLAPIADRLLPLPGNHDDQELFRTTFAHLVRKETADTHYSYVMDDYPIRLVGLDTSLPGRHDGCFDSSHEEWLETTLAAQPDKPTLIFTHFPPFATGISFMDDSGLVGARRFRDVIASHPQVRLVVAGHIHRPIQTTIANTLVSICPSTGNQLGLDLHPHRGSAVDEPPGYQLHHWNGESFVTHTGMVWDGQRMDLTEFVASIRARAARGEPFLKE